MLKALTGKQNAFVNEYLIDFNATQAYIRAGYSPKAANKLAHILLATPPIQAHLQKKIAERSKRTDITADFVLTSLHKVATSCMQEVPAMEYSHEEKCMVPRVDDNGNVVMVMVDNGGATKALELLAKHLGLFEKDNKQKPPSIYDVTLVLNNTEKPTSPLHAIGTGDQRQIGQGE